jgi:hypothetical protein
MVTRFDWHNSTGGMVAATSFWRALRKPIYCVAPMANVTDVAFRRIISDLAKPTVSWSCGACWVGPMSADTFG